ncbi:uncharacterized protein LOC133187377 [Saccostrea echinata]|uniref:uncharacterized protein LOC133187377 n=1 Tax=Saccostrea echinata TaxID=191078 RepID=UPI002A809799|nr:uncharacterized protein LOC133187377 [Saccostrea echinata]
MLSSFRTKMALQAVLFVLSLLSRAEFVHTAHPGIFTADQSSGSLGSLSSPSFERRNTQKVAVVDNGLFNQQKTLNSLSSLSNFDNHVHNIQQTPDQIPSELYPNEPIPTVVYTEVPRNPEQSPSPPDNSIIVESIQMQPEKISPPRKKFLSGQIDVSKQERAFTVDQPTIKKAVNRQKIVKEQNSSLSHKQNEPATEKIEKQRPARPQQIRFMSGNNIFKPGQKNISYRFTGKSFTKSPTPIKRPTPKAEMISSDTRNNQMNQKLDHKKTTLDSFLLREIATTESPVTVWKQSIQHGLYDTTKSFSVPITSHLHTEAPTKPPLNKYSMVNPTNGAVVGGHIVTQEKPPSDIIVNHHETSVIERNRKLSRDRYSNAQWQHQQKHNQQVQRHLKKQSSSLSSMNAPQKSNNEHSHVVTDPEAIADIIVSSSQQGAPSLNNFATNAGQYIDNQMRHTNMEHMHGANNLHEFNYQHPAKKQSNQINDFQNNGLRMGSLSNPNPVNLNNQQGVNSKTLPTEEKKHLEVAHRLHKNKEMLQQHGQFPKHDAITTHGENKILQGKRQLSELYSSTTLQKQNINNLKSNAFANNFVISNNVNAMQNNQKSAANTPYTQRKKNQQHPRDMKASVINKLQGMNTQQHHSRLHDKTPSTLFQGVHQQEHQTKHHGHKQGTEQHKKQSHKAPSLSSSSSLSNPSFLSSQRRMMQSQPGSKQPQGHSMEQIMNQGTPQMQMQYAGANEVQYNIVKMPPSRAEYFHKSIEHMPEPADVKRVQIHSANSILKNQHTQKTGSLRNEYNLRNDQIEARHYNQMNGIPSAGRVNQKVINSLSQTKAMADPKQQSAQSIYQMENPKSLYASEMQQNGQYNIINDAAKVNPQETQVIDTSFNIPKEIIANPNIQMLNIENPVQSGYSLAGVNILDIKPIKGLSPDIVQISKVTNTIPIIEIPINYNYYETTTIPLAGHEQNLHTTSSLAAQPPGLQRTFTKAPEVFRMSTGRACSYEVNPFNRNEYAMNQAEAQAGRFTSECPAGLHFRVDRCRCDWPVPQTNSNTNSCPYVVNPADKRQYAHSIQETRTGKLLDCPANLHFNEQKCRCDWPSF